MINFIFQKMEKNYLTEVGHLILLIPTENIFLI